MVVALWYFNNSPDFVTGYINDFMIKNGMIAPVFEDIEADLKANQRLPTNTVWALSYRLSQKQYLH